ncbi:hypothetical protein M9Y10_038656 [Tritrichomonas musculus]|uniref:Uncharacterized protein n=1 Tax=Tritrichomonas musculus TaxID=1915356 RepID=A0ABR2K916_9EUKA
MQTLNIFKQYIFKNPLYANFWYVYDAYRLVFSSGNSELLEEDELPDGLEEIFTPSKYSIVDTIYKLIRKLNNHINNHPTSSGDSNFTVEPGLNDIFIRNNMITQITDTISNIECNILLLNIPEDKNEELLRYNKEIFKVVLRKNVIYDQNGRYIKEFYIKTISNKVLCPVITYDQENDYCVVNNNSLIATRSIGPADENKLDGKYYIAFDKRLPFDPYILYMSGDLSIINQFSPTALKTDKAIKCSIIEADNALKLHKSDVHYFYKPSIITETEDYYKMVFYIEDDYVIPSNLEFVFKEYCFGNTWSLMWKQDDANINKGYWTGYNCQGCYNKRIITKCQTTCRLYGLTASTYALCTGVIIMVKDDELNNKLIELDDKGLMHSLWEKCTKQYKILLKDGTEKDAAEVVYVCHDFRTSSQTPDKPFENTLF